MKKSKYLVRVQLIREISSQYTLVRDGLIARGFTKRIKNKEGIEYRLPNGNYYAEGENTANEIFDIVAQVVSKIDPKASVVVSHISDDQGSLIWANLERC